MTTSNETQALLERIAELETKMAYQDVTISDLNEEIAVHQQRIDVIQQQLKAMFGQINNMKGSNMASEKEETPPPHY
ncbi:SlyX family protein [Echinimonas agarilytica]|uniref:Protein SlyX homolog n=1 Tax=Echinimonas agarilytica TaxID=1215918 RepID=A0AA41W3Z3_9GAMM|nr:SlyX family protein [Echinimonas agarilytica]MCM2678391.1 SlyX family protein [Echinimonas agarilytica]